MKKVILWVLFFVFLALIISPIDLAPGPLDDIVYAVIDAVIVALLGSMRAKRKREDAAGKAIEPPKEVPNLKE